MPTPLTGLDPLPLFPTTLTTLPLGGGQHVLGVLYSAVSGSGALSVAKAYLVTDGHAELIGASDSAGKDAGIALLREGRTLYLYVSEAAPDGPGSSSTVQRYTFPDALPAEPPDRTKALAQGIWDACGGMMRVVNTLAQKMRAIVEA